MSTLWVVGDSARRLLISGNLMMVQGELPSADSVSISVLLECTLYSTLGRNRSWHQTCGGGGEWRGSRVKSVRL